MSNNVACMSITSIRVVIHINSIVIIIRMVSILLRIITVIILSSSITISSRSTGKDLHKVMLSTLEPNIMRTLKVDLSGPNSHELIILSNSPIIRTLVLNKIHH